MCYLLPLIFDKVLHKASKHFVQQTSEKQILHYKRLIKDKGPLLTFSFDEKPPPLFSNTNTTPQECSHSFALRSVTPRHEFSGGDTLPVLFQFYAVLTNLTVERAF